MGWTYDPTQLAPLVIGSLLYASRATALARRGRPTPPAKLLSFAAAVVILTLALSSPIDTLGEQRLFSVHMAQHLLIGDVAPLLIVLGLSGPLLRPALAIRWLWRARGLAHPFVALPLWAADLWLWHLPALYDAALGNAVIHALEHACFFTCGLLLWTTLLGLLPGPRWFGRGSRLAALGFVWVTGGALANIFLWSNHAYYPPYVRAPRTWGLSAVADQRAGGGVMLLEMMLVGITVFIVAGLDWLAESERRQVVRETREDALR